MILSIKMNFWVDKLLLNFMNKSGMRKAILQKIYFIFFEFVNHYKSVHLNEILSQFFFDMFKIFSIFHKSLAEFMAKLNFS